MEEKFDKILEKLDENNLAVSVLNGKFDILTDKVEANSKAIDVLSQQIKTHEVKITELGAVVETNANTLDRLVIKVIHIEERLNNTLTKEQFVERADKIFGRVDRFVKLHESLDTELCALRHYYARLEDRVVVLERQAGMWR